MMWLRERHPHDCPVCEEGGECHLQDMTLMTGHNYRRYRFRKRTFHNQYLGPFLTHEMNRLRRRKGFRGPRYPPERLFRTLRGWSARE